MKGRKPIPSHLHIIRGLPGKRPLNKREPKPKRCIPSPPEHLSDAAKVAWGALSVKLDAMGVLTVADGWALEILAEQYVEIVELRKVIREEGRFITQEMREGERTLSHPAIKQLSDVEKRFQTSMTNFGLHPSARTRINAGPPDESEKDPAKKYFG